MTINDIINKIETEGVKLTKEHKKRIKKGYNHGRDMQKGQLRDSGELFFEGHSVPSVYILIDNIEEIADSKDIEPGKLVNTVIALLNHHNIYIQDNGEKPADILQKKFGEDVALRVDAMKNRNNGDKTYAIEFSRKGERYMAAMLFANILHNLQTAEYLSEEKIRDLNLKTQPYIELAEDLGFNKYATQLRKGVEQIRFGDYSHLKKGSPELKFMQ